MVESGLVPVTSMTIYCLLKPTPAVKNNKLEVNSCLEERHSDYRKVLRATGLQVRAAG